VAELVVFILLFGSLVLVGCFATTRTPRAMHDAQHYLHEQHKAEMKQYRSDGRLPPE
jgi:outer membrane biogenesis lipoprotein LolB